MEGTFVPIPTPAEKQLSKGPPLRFARPMKLVPRQAVPLIPRTRGMKTHEQFSKLNVVRGILWKLQRSSECETMNGTQHEVASQNKPMEKRGKGESRTRRKKTMKKKSRKKTKTKENTGSQANRCTNEEEDKEEKDDVEVSGEVMRRRRKGREDRVGLVSRGERTIMWSLEDALVLFIPLTKLVYTERTENEPGGSLWLERRRRKKKELDSSVEEGRKKPRISVSTADLIGFIRGKCVRPRLCNPFFTLARLNRMPSGTCVAARHDRASLRKD